MKAICCYQYGSPLQLQYRDIALPDPKPYEVRIRVNAAAINDYDWSVARGKPYVYRLMFGLRKPKSPVLGMEVSGVVDAVGSSVTHFQTGDAVFGDTSNFGFGCLAEAVCIHQDALIKKPGFINHEDAVTLPHAGLLALQGFEKAGLQQGESVLINGAGGGMGTFALYLAKNKQCHVTAVDSADKLSGLEAMGSDAVIDYRQYDYTRLGKQYDVILDCKTTRSSGAYRRALKPNGRYVTVGGQVSALFQIALGNLVFGWMHSKKVQVLALKPNTGLEILLDYYRNGILKTNVDGPYTLEKVPALIQYFGEGKHKGKIVVRP